MVLGLGAVFAAIIYRVNRIDDAAPGKYAERISIPDGAQVVSIQVSGDRLTLQLRQTSGDSIGIYDLATGERLATIPIESE